MCKTEGEKDCDGPLLLQGGYVTHQKALLSAQRSIPHLAANSIAHFCSFALKSRAISSRKKDEILNSNPRFFIRIKAHIST